MTREEATRLVRDSGPIGEAYKPYDESLVDALSALGILKLDEPNANVIFHERMAEHYGLVNRESFLRKLDAAGLRIVEK